MRYVFLIYADEVEYSNLSKEAIEANYEGHRRFGEEVGARGALVGGEELHPSTMATTVRRREGQTLTTDGPYAETKEQLGGFYILECKDLDEAIEFAAKIPDTVRGSVEIRPIVDHG